MEYFDLKGKKPKYRRVAGLSPRSWKLIILVLLVTFIVCTIAYFLEMAGRKFAMLAQIPKVYASAEPTKPVAEPKTDQQKEIVAYIQEVFGRDADKAFKLLSCENASLNPEAVNTAGNFPEGSRDIGVFQINEYWQKTQGKFLFNWKINVEIAHLLYEENGKSFHLWTCGRKLGV